MTTAMRFDRFFDSDREGRAGARTGRAHGPARACLLVAGALGVLAAVPAQGASLQSVSNWSGGASGLPTDVSMFIYVPDKVATNPPILTLIHYCGGTASAVFGQAQTGGIVKAADQYGFLIVAPSSGRCWDIVSSKSRTRDGGGDTHAIKQMVLYAISKYGGNAERVYATGDSSGGMTTQLLLAVYPDIFKGGASMAGVAAGCGNTTSSPGSYDGACGNAGKTPQQWGDIVRKMDPGYTGHRPRVQLFHGTADTTIPFVNCGESIKEWTNVLDLSMDPTSTEMNVTLGTHKATRKKWLNSCGHLVLEGFESQGGDHGPSDALFLSQYVIPFLGLDKTGPVDPEIAACAGDAGAAGSGGAGGSSGSAGRGGGAGTNGGAGATGTGARDGGSDAPDASGGGLGSGGTTGSGGVASGGGGSGGASTTATGGKSGSGGSPSGSGGALSSGGAPGSGGGNASGGATGTSTGGRSGSGGNSAGAGPGPDGPKGCSCGLGGGGSMSASDSTVLIALAGALGLARRRRSRRDTPRPSSGVRARIF